MESFLVELSGHSVWYIKPLSVVWIQSILNAATTKTVVFVFTLHVITVQSNDMNIHERFVAGSNATNMQSIHWSCVVNSTTIWLSRWLYHDLSVSCSFYPLILDQLTMACPSCSNIRTLSLFWHVFIACFNLHFKYDCYFNYIYAFMLNLLSITWVFNEKIFNFK